MTSKHMNWDKFVIGDRKPTSLLVGFTSDDSGWLCRQIQRATDGIWGHMLVGFRFEDDTACYFEALLGDGVTGPWPLDRLLAWREEPMHRAALVPISDVLSNFTDAEIAYALTRAIFSVGRHSYSAPQILAMRLSERYRLPMWRTEDRTVCSEFVAWVIQGIMDLRDRRRTKLDQVNPNSAWRRVMEERAGYGAVTRLRLKASELPMGATRTAKEAPLIREAP